MFKTSQPDFSDQNTVGKNSMEARRLLKEQERDVLQERKESISNYLNLFLSI